MVEQGVGGETLVMVVFVQITKHSCRNYKNYKLLSMPFENVPTLAITMARRRDINRQVNECSQFEEAFT